MKTFIGIYMTIVPRIFFIIIILFYGKKEFSLESLIAVRNIQPSTCLNTRKQVRSIE